MNIDDLKCCGNCIKYCYGECDEDDKDDWSFEITQISEPYDYCEKWKWNDLTKKKERS